MWRCFPWDPSAVGEPGDPRWTPREYQGEGRHDAPERYGAMYLSEAPVSAVAEQLARFRGRPFRAAFLRRRGHPLALARYELHDSRTVLDLDDPAALLAHELRPSQIATRNRTVTQATAVAAFDADPDRGGLRWWSTLEASWINVTLFAERVADDLTIDRPAVLDAASGPVADACRALGLTAP